MIKLFSMFSGYGGAEFALKRAGIEFECVGYSDIKKHAIKCYEQNHKGIKNYGDATKIIPEELPDFNLLTGGFPCQSFSLQGNKLGFKDIRGTLIYDILRIAEVKKPKYMLLENVPGILSNDNGETIRVITNAIRSIGYDVAYKLLNSKDFGVPQNRERVWFICKYGEFEFGEVRWPVEKYDGMILKDLLENNVDKSYEKKVEPLNREINVNDIKFKESINDIYIYDTNNYKFRSNNIIIHNKGISNCLMCAIKRIIDKDEKLRVLTEKESFRLMGFFNDEINIDGLTYYQCIDLAGNGWDINLAAEIFKINFNDIKSDN